MRWHQYIRVGRMLDYADLASTILNGAARGGVGN
jgi:hypothetical protein